MWSRHTDDPRGFFSWRLPAGAGADVLSAGEIDRLKALPNEALIDLLDRVDVAVKELTSLKQQLASRWVIERVCPSCAGAVHGRSDKRYCSRACQQRAYMARKKEN
jgi:hypothetical protein